LYCRDILTGGGNRRKGASLRAESEKNKKKKSTVNREMHVSLSTIRRVMIEESLVGEKNKKGRDKGSSPESIEKGG